MTTTIIVSTSAQLLSALKNAKGGENIVLNAGDYGKLSLGGIQYASQVTITSADPNHTATFSGLSISKMSNLAFNDVSFHYKAAVGASLELSPFSIANSTNVTITNSHFTGDNATGVAVTANGFGTGNGLYVVGSSNVTISHNDFQDFHRGLLISKTNGLNITANDISGMSSDGMDFAQVSNVKIDSNHIHDFVRSPLSLAHPDMIQFWTAGTTSPSTNISITNNFLDQGSGQETQSIFMNNEAVNGGMGTAMYYQNVVISNNVIRNGESHGISVGQTTGLRIDHNTLIESPTSQTSGNGLAPLISVASASTAVNITSNVVPSSAGTLTTHSPAWTVSNNFVAEVDNPNASNFVGRLFYDPLDTTHANIMDFQAIAGTAISNGHIGAQISPSSSVAPYYGYVTATQTEGPNLTSPHQTLDTSHIYNLAGKVVTTGATAVWDFGDGTTGTGLITNHVYSSGGNFTATAILSLVDGTKVQVDKTLIVASADALDVNFEKGAVDQSAVVNGVILDRATVVNASGGGHALMLNGGTAKYDVDSAFANNSEFTVAVDFKKNVGQEAGGGTLLYFSGAYNVSVGADKITANIVTTHGVTVLKADHVGITDADWHRVTLSFSGQTGQVNLVLDGHVVASASGLEGAIQNHSNNADLYVGNPFGGSFTGQIDNVHVANVALDTPSLTQGTLATPHADYVSLTQFDAASAFAASHTDTLNTQIPLQTLALDPQFGSLALHQSHDFWIL